ncbi:potassium/proton antiporter [Deinococcus peraridilitoris]|uniref:NhaP-type Na+(K+)/H+ antiporter n=1 Tax=Deinococcus peraridilitoris (strain DSM 19664 / LMG 22246 / CIP 109416 / KR-200) TaxID=937777 RepID=K9ZZ62_DEIPD|nr:potassium/proton antiporter [Deinococcus peraridilitoris]AFZ66202.1 NhaP-type Na+(K+)/H+ antiporter [Deinococcus peraridilitoris DSM 19664]
MPSSSIFDVPILIGAALILLSLFASKLGGRLGVPALLLFVVIGMLAGSEGLGGIPFENYELTQLVGIITLVLILYSGGLETRWKDTRPVLAKGLVLSTLGVFITAGVLGAAAHHLLHLPWLTSLLLGAVVSSTDASAVFSVLRERALGLKGQIKPLLEFESGTNDPMAVFLVIGLTSLIMQPSLPWYSIIPLFLQQMLIGGAVGYVAGQVAVHVLNNINLKFDGLYSVLSISLMALMYGSAAVVGGSGFLAVYIGAVVLGNSDFIHKRSLRLFHDGLTYLFEIGMFLLLGLLVFPKQLLSVAGPAMLLSLILMFIARPLAIYLSLALSPMKKRHKSMIAWVGLRGAVPIILATFPLLAGVPGAQIIFNVAFFIVLTSILIQGTSLPFVARLLRVDTDLVTPQVSPLSYASLDSEKTDLVDIRVPRHSIVEGKRIVDLGFPEDALIVLIHRDGEYVIPKGATTVEAGDGIQILGSKADVDEVRRRIAQSLPKNPPPLEELS